MYNVKSSLMKYMKVWFPAFSDLNPYSCNDLAFFQWHHSLAGSSGYFIIGVVMCVFCFFFFSSQINKTQKFNRRLTSHSCPQICILSQASTYWLLRGMMLPCFYYLYFLLRLDCCHLSPQLLYNIVILSVFKLCLSGMILFNFYSLLLACHDQP